MLFTALFILYDLQSDEPDIQSEYKTAINNKYVNMAQAENYIYEVASERIKEFTPNVYDKKQIRPEKIVINDFDGSDKSNWIIHYKISDIDVSEIESTDKVSDQES